MKARNKLYTGNKPAKGRLITGHETWDLYQIRTNEDDRVYVHCKIISRIPKPKANFRVDWVRGTGKFIANGDLKMLREHEPEALGVIELEMKLIFPPILGESNVVYFPKGKP